MPLAPAPISEDLDLPTLNALFENSDPAKIIAWAAAQFGNELVMSSSFGAESACLLHLANTALPGIRIIMIDTGYLFPETHQFMEELRLRWKLNVWVYRTRNDPFAYLKQAGEGDPTWRKDIDACCAANKNEPMERAMADLAPKAWLRGIRRNQAETRKDRQFIERSPRYGCWAISPLLNWGGREIHAYMKKHSLPYHPLYEKGFMSIGCNPQSCTRAILPGEDPRAGRWAGQQKVECGINLNSLDSSQL